MRAIHQLLPAATPADAITGQAFAWQELLAAWGYSGEIVAEHVHPDLAKRVHRLDRKGRRLLEHGRIVLRYAIWSTTADVALQRPAEVALCYHNITPGHLLRDFNPAIAELCDRGRRALSTFARPAAVIADSHFNAAELRASGLGEASVVPLLLDLPKHRAPRVRSHRDPVVLTVGRLVPNKRIEDVIKAFALYQRHRAPEASLIVVGSDAAFENYRSALGRLVARVGARHVFLTGRISREARDAWYRRADVYISMSVHEGFCAPLIEALGQGVPVVARGAGAVPETISNAGIIVDGADLALVAEALHELVSSERTRSALAEAAERRLDDLRSDVIAAQIRAALEPLLEPRATGKRLRRATI
jgi:glycosyltransferase involved in cell wall biosynthesis